MIGGQTLDLGFSIRKLGAERSQAGARHSGSRLSLESATT